MKKIATILFIFLILTTHLFAQPVTETKTETETEAEEGKIHLTFVEIMPSDERTLILKSAIRNYEALHPNIGVEIISLETSTAEEKLRSMLAEGQTIDVCEVRDQSVAKLINQDLLLSLNDYLDNSITEELVEGAFIGTSSFDGSNYYFISQCIYVKALFVRTDILEEYGIEIPTTMAELIEACQKITSAGKGQYGYAHKGTNSCRVLDPLLLGGIENLDPNNIYLTKDGKFYLDTPSGRATLQMLLNFFKTGCPAESVNWSFSDQIEAFTSGKVAFFVQDPDAIPAIDAVLEESQYTVVPIPVGSTGKRYVDYGFLGLSIAATSKHPDEAFDFISYLISAEVNAQICDFYGALPINKKAYEYSTVFNREVYMKGMDSLTAEDTVIFTFPLQDDRFKDYMSLYTATIKDLLLENKTVDEAVQILKDFWGY